MNKGKYYITTAIAYTSGIPHIGNSYEVVLADSIARFKRKDGYDVFFQTGTDEHGQKIELKAQEQGVTPKEYVDGVAGEVRRICDALDTSYDKFIRTTDGYHEKEVQKIFKRLYDQGDIYKGYYEGMYCTPCEAFWTESQLVDGKCPDCGREVKPAKEEAYFFRMSKYADRLIEHINSHPEFIQPVSRKNEMMNNFLLPGLHRQFQETPQNRHDTGMIDCLLPGQIHLRFQTPVQLYHHAGGSEASHYFTERIGNGIGHPECTRQYYDGRQNPDSGNYLLQTSSGCLHGFLRPLVFYYSSAPSG